MANKFKIMASGAEVLKKVPIKYHPKEHNDNLSFAICEVKGENYSYFSADETALEQEILSQFKYSLVDDFSWLGILSKDLPKLTCTGSRKFFF